MPPRFDVKRFNRWAATYDRSPAQRWYFEPVHRRMLDLVEADGPAGPPNDVVDVGCGTGRLLRAASVRWPEARLIGIDPAEGMIREAERLDPKAAFMVAPAENLPIPDRSVDLVLTSLSFHHWDDQTKGLQEIARVLRPGGLFCLADHALRLGNIFGEKVRSASQFRALIGHAGLEFMSSRRLWIQFVFIALARKGELPEGPSPGQRQSAPAERRSEE